MSEKLYKANHNKMHNLYTILTLAITYVTTYCSHSDERDVATSTYFSYKQSTDVGICQSVVCTRRKFGQRS